MASGSASNPQPAGHALAIERITVGPERIVVELICPQAKRTTPQIAERALKQRPNLARHACINSKGSTFANVIERTPLPHLLEHVVIDLLTERSNVALDVFTGTSEWVDKDAGSARVILSFTDDLEALAAIRDGAQLIEAWVADAL